MSAQAWHDKHTRALDSAEDAQLMRLIQEAAGLAPFGPDDMARLLRRFPRANGQFAKDQIDTCATTASRLQALENIGHATDKVELLILGGTWLYYPADYQEWFIQRCFDAMNGCDSSSLAEAQKINETAVRRNVGLVIET